MADKLIEGAYGKREPLTIEQDPTLGIVTIEGTAFTYELLRLLGQETAGLTETGRIERLVGDGGGTVTFRRIPRCPKCGLDLNAAVIE